MNIPDEMYVSPGQKLNIISLYTLSASPCSRCFVTELPFKGGAYTHFIDIYASMKSVWVALLSEVQQYNTSNAVMQLKCMMEQYSISVQDCHIRIQSHDSMQYMHFALLRLCLTREAVQAVCTERYANVYLGCETQSRNDMYATVQNLFSYA